MLILGVAAMLASISGASYDATTGRVKATLNNSTVNGYQNTVEIFQSYGVLSVPVVKQLVNIEQQAQTQVMMTGYNNSIVDSNFVLNSGETCIYSPNWYNVVAINGIYMQVPHTASKENAMMGQSTNSVMLDILTYLIALYEWASTHTHQYSPGSNPPTQTAVSTQTVPSDSGISSDQTYISGNHNLAITGTYEPR